MRTDRNDDARLWARIDAGLYVGNGAGEYLGSIEVGPDGRYDAFGARAEFIGRFESLDDAKGAAERYAAQRTAVESTRIAAPRGRRVGMLAELLERWRRGSGTESPIG